MAKPVSVSDATFESEVLQAETPVLTDFWADWCMPCRMVAPLVEAAAKEYAGRLKVTKVNVDANSQTAAAYGIRSIPTLLLFKRGKVVSQIIGAVPLAALKSRIETVLAAED
ncbi:MAG: thioredoxin [Chloroflexi bacterium]|nr:thioredoxin [Chloroflexota bacterium]